MENGIYVLRDENGKIILNRGEELGVFKKDIYLMLVNPLIDKLKIDSDKYSEKLIELKDNQNDIKTITRIAEVIGYHVQVMSSEEIDKIKHGRSIHRKSP